MRIISICFCFIVFLATTSAQINTTSKDTLINNRSNPLEIGIHSGVFKISNDVDQPFLPGYGIGIHIRKAINPALSFRGEFLYGNTTGLDAIPSGNNLIDDNGIFNGYGEANPWFFAYKTQFIRLNFQALIELTNLGKDLGKNKFNFYLYGGLGVNSHGTKLNLRDAQNELYTDLLSLTGYNTINDPNTSSGRKAIKNALISGYDNTYETEAPKEFGKFRLGDETNIHPEISLGTGISYHVLPTLDISLDHQFVFSNNNYLDGKVWRSNSDYTNGIDVVQYTSIRLSFHLHANPPKPLYWSNPWNDTSDKLRAISMQQDSIKKQLSDSDQDGVIQAMDQETQSKANAVVNTKGKTISPANIDHNLNDNDIKALQSRLSEIEKILASHETKSKNEIDLIETINQLSKRVTILESAIFTQIFFATNSDQLDLEGLKALSWLSSFIFTSDVKCISIEGYADEYSLDDYNNKLGLRRAQTIEKTLMTKFGHTDLKIIVQSFGEQNPSIKDANNADEHAINRRATIRICE